MQRRQPWIDNAVFALAFLLAGVLGYYAYHRLRAPRTASAPANDEPAGPPRLENTLRSSGTERVVPSLPAVQLAPESGARPSRKTAIPSP